MLFGFQTMRKYATFAFLILSACNQTRTPERGVDTTLPEVPGKVSGTLSYPSRETEFPELEACAENLAGKTQGCVSGFPSSSYELSLPAGTYFMFTRRKEDMTIRAYYSDFIRCGSMDSCTSHAKIPVAVAEGEETSGIELGDWENLPKVSDDADDINMATETVSAGNDEPMGAGNSTNIESEPSRNSSNQDFLDEVLNRGAQRQSINGGNAQDGCSRDCGSKSKE